MNEPPRPTSIRRSSGPDPARTDSAVPAPTMVGSLHVEAWPDPVVDQLGHDPRSSYVEQFWLPVLGPSSVWLLRRLSAELDQRPSGCSLDPAQLAADLGLGTGAGRHSPLMRTIERCCRFGLATRSDDLVRVRRRLPPLTRGQVARLSSSLQLRHQELQDTATDRRVRAAQAARAKRLALTLLEIGEDPAATERHLHLWRYEPDIARTATQWATDRHRAAAAAAGSTPPATGDTAA